MSQWCADRVRSDRAHGSPLRYVAIGTHTTILITVKRERNWRKVKECIERKIGMFGDCDVCRRAWHRGQTVTLGRVLLHTHIRQQQAHGENQRKGAGDEGSMESQFRGINGLNMRPLAGDLRFDSLTWRDPRTGDAGPVVQTGDLCAKMLAGSVLRCEIALLCHQAGQLTRN